MHTLNDQRRDSSPAPFSRSASLLAWRRCVALFTLLVFVLLVATSGSHVHDSTVAAHDCALCSAVVDAVGDAPAPPALVLHLPATSYFLTIREPVTVAYVSPSLLPPGCGPPLLSA